MSALPTTSRPRPFGLERTADAEVLRTPPHDLHAETMVLGSMLRFRKTIPAICDFLTKKDVFFKEENQIVFEVIRDLHYAKIPVDVMILATTLRTKKLLDQVGGEEYLVELAKAVPIDAHAEYFAAVVKEKAMLRETIQACDLTMRECFDADGPASSIIDRGEARIHAISSQQEVIYPTPLSEIMPDLIQTIDSHEEREKLVGLPTGFVEIDELTGGLIRGDMIVIAARPSVGKTSFAFNIIENLGIERGKTCLMFSLEMRKMQLAIRALCGRAGVNSRDLKSGRVGEDPAAKDRVGRAAAELNVRNIWIDDTPAITLREMRTKALRMKGRHGLDLLAVDYLGLMTGERRENKVQETAVLSAGIKALARELEVPVLCLSQLNRACEQEQRLPQLSDLRNSGDIEQDADLVILLHREACYHRGDQQWIDSNQDKINEAIAIIAKQRNGPCDNVKLTYLPAQTKFLNYTPGV